MLARTRVGGARRVEADEGAPLSHGGAADAFHAEEILDPLKAADTLTECEDRFRSLGADARQAAQIVRARVVQVHRVGRRGS